MVSKTQMRRRLHKRIAEMADRRTGLRKLRGLASAMCKTISAFTPLIIQVYPTSTVLHALLVSINTLCAELVIEIDDTLPVGV